MIIVVLSERSAGTVLVTFFQDKDLKIEDKYGTTNKKEFWSGMAESPDKMIRRTDSVIFWHNVHKVPVPLCI